MKITFREILELDLMLLGSGESKPKITGILNEKLNIKPKYWLGRLSEDIQKEKTQFLKLRDELIIKYGDKNEEGLFEIKPIVDNKTNPKFIEFQKEVEGMLNEEIEINIPKMDLDSFDFESESNYSYLFKYIIKE